MPDVGPQLRLLSAWENGMPTFVVGNYSCHPTAYGGGRVSFPSPDFPGRAEHHLAEHLGRMVPFVYLMGCAGDINTGKFCAEGSDGENDRFGRRLADAAAQALNASEPLPADGKVAVANRLIRCEAGAWLPVVAEARKRFDVASREVAPLWRAGEQIPDDLVSEWRAAVKRLDFCQLVDRGSIELPVSRISVGPLILGFVAGERLDSMGAVSIV